MYEKYMKGRNSYNYPSVGLCARQALDNFKYWNQAYIRHEFITTLELDMHHCGNLLSDNDDEVLLGIYSVMYWGYITSGRRSEIRCDWLSVGNARNPKHSLSTLGKKYGIEIIRNCRMHLERSEYAYALKEIRKLPHVGASFGSKYLAFMDPENVGVLDNKIMRHLESNSFEDVLEKETIAVLIKSSNVAERFQAFCMALNAIKIMLNKNNCKWKDESGAQLCRFRALDVERALFSIAKKADSSS